MKPPRVRFSVRAIMVAVAVTGILLGGAVREQRRRAGQERAIAAIEKVGGLIGARPMACIGEPKRRPVVSIVFDITIPGTSDADLAALAWLPELQSLSFFNSQITDAGLARLGELNNLRELRLGEARITDAGLGHLKRLTNLRELNIAGTPITDAGLVNLRGLKELRFINLAGTKVTDAGLAHLKGLTKLENLSRSHSGQGAWARTPERADRTQGFAPWFVPCQ
jgi:hypothetical protein